MRYVDVAVIHRLVIRVLPQPAAVKNEPLLVHGEAHLALDVELDVFDRRAGFDKEVNGLTSQRLHNDREGS